MSEKITQDQLRDLVSTTLKHYQGGKYLNLADSVDLSDMQDNDGIHTVFEIVIARVTEAVKGVKPNIPVHSHRLEKARHYDRVNNKCKKWLSEYTKNMEKN